MIDNYDELIALVNQCNKLANEAIDNATKYIDFRSSTKGVAEEVFISCTVAILKLNAIREHIETLNKHVHAKSLNKTQKRLTRATEVLKTMANNSFEASHHEEVQNSITTLVSTFESCVDRMRCAMSFLDEL